MKSLFALCAALITLVLTVGSAAAHVTVSPTEARPSTSVTFSVRVPVELEQPTIRLRVEFPDGVTVSRFQPKPGWQRSVDRDASGRITAVTWTGGRIEAGEYDDFELIARTPDQAGKIAFKAYQTYQSGETHEWIDAEGAARPAAIVDVRANAGAAPGAPGALTAPAAQPAPAVTPVSTSVAAAPSQQAAGGGSDLPLFVALAAVALGLLSVALSAVALTRRPRPT
jgi:YD repeat-containing protein